MDLIEQFDLKMEEKMNEHELLNKPLVMQESPKPMRVAVKSQTNEVKMNEASVQLERNEMLDTSIQMSA